MSLTAYKLSSTDPRSVELTLTCEPEKFELCQRIWDQPGVIPSLDETIGVKNG